VMTESLPHPLERLRARYPAALLCTACLTILATRPESYTRSGLTEVQRRAYVCAECRADQAETERLAGIRRANLTHARAARQASRQPGTGPTTAPDETPPPGMSENRGVARRGFVTLGPVPLTSAHARWRDRHRGGRPRQYEAGAARQRAYRARRRLAPQAEAR
jgi:hypothetical protein